MFKECFAVGSMGTLALCGVGTILGLLFALPISMVAVGKNTYLSNKRGNLNRWAGLGYPHLLMLVKK